MHLDTTHRLLCAAMNIRLLLLHQLLLFVIVCRMAQIVAGSLNLIPSGTFFLFIQTLLIFDVCPYTLAVLSPLRCRFTYEVYHILGNHRYARRPGGRQPAPAKRRLHNI